MKIKAIDWSFIYDLVRNKYSPDKIDIFIQGSYANNTCVRNESDVVRCTPKSRV